MIPAGAYVIDITPPSGLRMAGYALREAPADGVQDRLSVRALVIGDTGLVVADVIGMHEDPCRSIRARTVLPDAAVVVAGTHTHGGPITLPGRLGGGEDPAFLAYLEDACVEALNRAFAARRPARLLFGQAPSPDIVRNRRHPGGATDDAVPVLRAIGIDGVPIATLACHACHPGVVGPGNRRWTADLAGAARPAIEAAHGAPCLMLTGCAGDGDVTSVPWDPLEAHPCAGHGIAALGNYGARLAAAVLAAPLGALLDQDVGARSAYVALDRMPARQAPAELARAWRAERAGAEPRRARLLTHWIGWAEGRGRAEPSPWTARVTCLDWGGVRLIALPGEVFARTALDLRARLDGPAIVTAYAEGCPGYIPPLAEYAHGGYEIDIAHRFYGEPGPFAPGSAERLLDAALRIA